VRFETVLSAIYTLHHVQTLFTRLLRCISSPDSSYFLHTCVFVCLKCH